MKQRVALLLANLTGRVRAVALVVANRDLRHLQIAWASFNFAEYAFVVALGVLAFERGGAAAVGLMALIRTLPAMAAGPLLAVLSDRLPRQRVLVVGLMGRALASAGLFVIVGADSPIGVLYLLAALDAAIGTSIWPAQAALLPELSRSRDELAASNAVSSVVEQAGLLVGPLATGIVLVLFDAAAVFAIGSGIFVLGALMAATIATDRVTAGTTGHRVTFDMLEGWKVLRANRGSALVVSLWTVEALVLGAIDVFTVVVAIDLLGFGDSAVGFLGAINGFGGVIGAIAMTTFSRGNPFARYLGIGLLVLGAGVLFTGLWAVLVPVVVGFLMVGVAGSQVDIAAQTLLQRSVGEDHLGRVLGIYEGLYWGSLGIGGLLAGWLIVATSVQVAVVGCGVAVVLLAVVARGPLRRVDASVEVPAAPLDALCANPVFQLLAVPTLEHLARQAEVTDVEPGVIIVRQDDAGDHIYLIEQGSVEVEVDGVHVADLGRHDVFGEIAPLRHVPRTATVRSAAATTLLVLDGAVFAAAVSAHTSSVESVDAMVVGRLAGIGRARRSRGF